MELSVKCSLAFEITLPSVQNPSVRSPNTFRRPDFPRREITNKYTVVVTNRGVEGERRKKGSPIKRGGGEGSQPDGYSALPRTSVPHRRDREDRKLYQIGERSAD